MRENRTALVTDLEKLTRVMKTINSERDSLDTALRVGPLALGNLAVAFNSESGSIGSRIGLQGTFGNPDGLLCAIVMQSDPEEEFDEIFGRIRARGLDYWADPFRRHPGEINTHDGGRGVYWLDPNGHVLEIITRPYGG